MSRSHWVTLLLIGCLALVSAGCGAIIRGQSGGENVDVAVQLGREWVRAHSQPVVIIGDGPGAEDGQEVGYGFGHGRWYSSTEVELVASTRPGGSELMRAPLSWGGNRFQLPLFQGSTVYWAIVVSGGRSGTQLLGDTTIDSRRLITIDLSALPGDLRVGP